MKIPNKVTRPSFSCNRKRTAGLTATKSLKILQLKVRISTKSLKNFFGARINEPCKINFNVRRNFKRNYKQIHLDLRDHLQWKFQTNTFSRKDQSHSRNPEQLARCGCNGHQGFYEITVNYSRMLMKTETLNELYRTRFNERFPTETPNKLFGINFNRNTKHSRRDWFQWNL